MFYKCKDCDDMKLEDGEYICKTCKGKGAFHSSNPNGASRTCHICNGSGKIDWIINVVGSKNEITPISFRYMGT